MLRTTRVWALDGRQQHAEAQWKRVLVRNIHRVVFVAATPRPLTGILDLTTDCPRIGLVL